MFDELQELRAREEIRDMYAHVCFFYDHERPDLFADSFTEEGILWLSDRGSYRGREEIRRHVGRRRSTTLHLIHNVTFGEISADTATAYAYFQILNLTDASTVAYGTYDDLLRRVSGRWYWHRKRVNFRFRSPEYLETAPMRRPDFGTELEGPLKFADTLS